ncbi:MAG: zf-HC2 domain-containing protein [Fimbriimonadales bacterium]|nr:zf-HC2 domain-containing protein [Fimbriimonadales bacterium]
MGKILHCPEWEEKLSLYVDGVLNPFDENAVEAHLSRCDSCRATVALWRSVGQSVRRLPRELPPPYLRERILASTTRRRRLSRRLLPGWRVLAPALGVALLLGWLTLPRPEPVRERITSIPAPRVLETIPAYSTEPDAAATESLPSAPLVIVLQSAPSYRTASPPPRWLAQNRLSPAPTAPESPPAVVVMNDPTPRFAPASAAPPTIVTEIAEPSEPPATPAETMTVNTPPRPATTSTATRDLTSWLQQLNQQLREEDRRQITGATQRDSNKRRFFVPIVTVDLK